MIELDKQALDSAYRDHVGRIFGNWVRDGIPPPTRAAAGFRNVRRAYIDAMTDIEKREHLLLGRSP